MNFFVWAVHNGNSRLKRTSRAQILAIIYWRTKVLSVVSGYAFKPSQSAEDYLERIHELLESKGTAHVADIAQSLGVGQPSVTSMVQKLADEGYLHYEKYRALTLTDAGRAVAEQIRDRHEVLAGFFTLFELDAETQARDIEGRTPSQCRYP